MSSSAKPGWLELSPMRALLALERVWLDGSLRARSAGVKLWLAPDRDAAAELDAGAAHALHFEGRCWRGVMRATHDALPLADSSVALIVLQHVLEDGHGVDALLRECERVLAADGELIVLGLNPMSAWHPWIRLGARGPRRWRLAGRLRASLGELGLKVAPTMGLGPLRPGGRMEALAFTGARRLPRAAYALRARKREAQVIPLRRTLSRAAPSPATLVPSASARSLREGAA
jgi:SAM-dependent methyltransferase